MMFKVMAIVHSLKSQDEVTILHENGPNDVIAEYGGKRCTAIYNIFNGLYYVDDKYGILQDQDICPSCGEKINERSN
jgi:hypothetical protein